MYQVKYGLVMKVSNVLFCQVTKLSNVLLISFVDVNHGWLTLRRFKTKTLCLLLRQMHVLMSV